MGLEVNVDDFVNPNGNGTVFPIAVRKRDGRLVDYVFEKQVDSIYSAAESIQGRDRKESERVAMEAVKILTKKGLKIATAEEIDAASYEALRLCEHNTTAHMYKVYGQNKRKIMEMKTRGVSSQGNTTDSFLMVSSASDESAKPWDRDRIVESLVIDADLPPTVATKISKAIEISLGGLSGFKSVSTSLIRELAIEEMLKRERFEAAERYRSFGIPRADLERMISDKNKENANIVSSNPEAVGYNIVGKILKEYALSGGIFSQEVAEAHSRGIVHVHNLEAPVRVYCSSHSLEYLKKFGLVLQNLQSSSSSARHARTLTGHLNTFLASMQAYYAGALGEGYMNIFYAPEIEADLEEMGLEAIDYKLKDTEELKKRIDEARKGGRDVSELELKLKDDEEKIRLWQADPISILPDEKIKSVCKQEFQHLIFSSSQNAFSRGGQTLFLDFNMHTGVPKYLWDTPAVGVKGKYAMKKQGRRVYLKERKLEEKTSSGYPLMELIDPETERVVMREKLEQSNGTVNVVQEPFLESGEKLVTYGDYDKLAKTIFRAAMNIWGKGDSRGTPFAFPKFDMHVNEDTFKDPEQVELLKEACKIASENGSPYFIFDRDEVTLSACCRLRTALTDNYVLKHPESMRFCGFLNVTINLPQAAYRAAKKNERNIEGLLSEIDSAMDIAVKAHLQKRDYIRQLQGPGLPQWQTGMPSMDGQPYIDLDKATYIIGLIGLNEAMQSVLGKELHELTPEETEQYALRTITHMNLRAKEYGSKLGLKFSLEETPAESASRRLAKSDIARFPEAKGIVKGGEEPYYTNSIHFRADAPIDLITRIRAQSLYHPAIESGAMIHAFIGEEKPSPESIYTLVEKVFRETQAAQITVSPEFTICRTCNKTYRGLKDECPNEHN